MYGRLHEQVDFAAAIGPTKPIDIGIKSGAITPRAPTVERYRCFLYCFVFVYLSSSNPEKPEGARHTRALAVVDEEDV